MNNRQIVLVTGASSGIGKAVAQEFSKNGYTVYGTSRRAAYQTAGTDSSAVTMIPLTLEDAQSVADAVAYVMDKHGRIDVLVNAAGSGIAGAIEETTADEARAQFEVCYFGVVTMLNHVLPHMRKAGSGTVINIGSMASFFPLPFQGIYSGAKAALYMLTCALRMEIEAFGIRVCQVDPGDTKTGFTDKRVLTGKSRHTAYKKLFTRGLFEMIRSEQMAPGPEKCAKIVLKMAQKKRPPARTFVGFSNKLLYVATKFAPWGAMKKVVCGMYLRKDPPENGPLADILKRIVTIESGRKGCTK